jgi:hypothetical protein
MFNMQKFFFALGLFFCMFFIIWAAAPISQAYQPVKEYDMILMDQPLESSGNIPISSLKGYNEIMLQVKAQPGDKTVAKGFGVLPLDSSGIGTPNFIRIPISKTDGTMTYRTFYITSDIQISYSLTSDEGNQYLCVYVR